MIRWLGVVLICVVLTLSLFGANLTVAADRGPMDQEHVTTSAAEAGVYTALQDEVIEIVREDMPTDEIEGLGLPVDRVIEETVTPEWIQAEAERNTENFYAFLDGDANLEVYIDLRSLRDNARDAIHRAMADLEYAEFGLERLDNLLEGPAEYERERLAMRSDLLAEAGFDREEGYGNPTLAAMIADEESYEAERNAAYDEVTEEIMDRLEVEHGFGHERIEPMLESEESYQDHQESVPDDREDAVREQTEEEIHDRIADDAPEIVDPHVAAIANLTAVALTSDMPHDEFVAEYDAIAEEIETDVRTYVEENTDEFDEEIREEVDAELAALDPPEALEPGIEDLADLVVTAITTDMSHATFVDEYDAIADDLDDRATDHLWQNREEYEDEIDDVVGEEIDDDLPEPLVEEVEAFADVVIEAILSDMAFETFAAEIEEIEERMADAIVAHLFEDEDAVPARLELTGEINREAADELALMQTAASVLGLLAIGLPVLSLLLAGGVYLIARDVGTTAISVGVAAILGGGGSYVLAAVVTDAIADRVFALDLSEGLAAAFEAFVHAVFDPLAIQSMVVLASGIVLTIGGIGHTFDLHERLREEGLWPIGEATEEAAEPSEPADEDAEGE